MPQRLVGGYVTLKSRAVKSQMNSHTTALDRPVGPRALAALNFVQKTRWRINVDVLRVVRECMESGAAVGGLPPADDLPIPAPLPGHEFEALSPEERKRRVRKIEELHSANATMRGQRAQVYRRVALAAELAVHPTIWFPHFLDFRGRVYPIPQDLTPQGDSMCKGLLEFAEGQLIDDRGLYWLEVAFANAMGHDKLPLDERAAWTEKHYKEVERTAQDPMSMVDWWAGDGVDSPWEALALALAIPAAMAGRPVHVPVRLDATCSGIQHLSALMRDSLSARLVNLMNTGTRQDIYGDVARVAAERIALDAANGHELAPLWLGRVERKTCKRAVMTTPYGVTPRGISDQLVLDGFASHIEGALRYKAADYLRDVIVSSLDTNIGAPRRAMQYFQETAEALCAAEVPMTWTTPADMTVRQGYFEMADRKVKTLQGEVWYREELPDAGLVKRKQALASAPNVIHSFDAAHLMLTALACRDAGIKDMALVHDSFGTHANQIDLMGTLLREQFVEIYSQPQLELWRESVAGHSGVTDLPPVPPLGDLDVKCVLDSPFFFS